MPNMIGIKHTIYEAELIFVASLRIVCVVFVVVGREEAVMLLMSLPHLYLLSKRFFRRIVESLKDVVTGGAGLAPLLDRILYSRSVFFLSMKDSRCL